MDMKEMNLNDLEAVSGGDVVKSGDGKQFWIVRHDGTVAGTAPTQELAIQYAKQLNTSPEIITKEQYKAKYGRDLVW